MNRREMAFTLAGDDEFLLDVEWEYTETKGVLSGPQDLCFPTESEGEIIISTAAIRDKLIEFIAVTLLPRWITEIESQIEDIDLSEWAKELDEDNGEL